MPKRLILMRGCSGSGKSYKARQLKEEFGGIILSTDDIFTDSDGEVYLWCASWLKEAHLLNQGKARLAMERGISPVIIDNTNTRLWEMENYVRVAKELGYSIEYVESDAPWKDDPVECHSRNSHGVPLEVIKSQQERFESL